MGPGQGMGGMPAWAMPGWKRAKMSSAGLGEVRVPPPHSAWVGEGLGAGLRPWSRVTAGSGLTGTDWACGRPRSAGGLRAG